MTTWNFPVATVVRVLDGDTICLDVDQGFYETYRGTFRLLGLNARELHEPGGPEAKTNLETLLPVGAKVSLTSVKNDKYAPRWDALVYIGDSRVPLSADLISTGWAAAWDGNGVKPVPPWPRP